MSSYVTVWIPNRRLSSVGTSRLGFVAAKKHGTFNLSGCLYAKLPRRGGTFLGAVLSFGFKYFPKSSQADPVPGQRLNMARNLTFSRSTSLLTRSTFNRAGGAGEKCRVWFDLHSQSWREASQVSELWALCPASADLRGNTVCVGQQKLLNRNRDGSIYIERGTQWRRRRGRASEGGKRSRS